MCDTEHMFDCPVRTIYALLKLTHQLFFVEKGVTGDDEQELDTLARTLQNRELDEHELDKFVETMTNGGNALSGVVGDDNHKTVAKKYFSKKVSCQNEAISR